LLNAHILQKNKSSRHLLIESSSTRKYLLYAISKILLVVTGILIALQINNWNEREKAEIKVSESLIKLSYDLRFDIQKFNKIDTIYDQWLEECQYIFDEVLSGKKKITSIDEYVPGRGSLFYISVRESSYTEMINTGLLYQIKDNALSSSTNN